MIFNKKILVVFLILLTLIIFFFALYYVIPPSVRRSNPRDNASNVPIRSSLVFELSKKCSPKQGETFTLFNELGLETKGSIIIEKNKLTFSPDDKYHLIPGANYEMRIEPVSLTGRKGKPYIVSFKTITDIEGTSDEVRAALTAATDSFEEGKVNGFEFVAKLPIDQPEFTIKDAQEDNDGNVELQVIYKIEEEKAIDALDAWLLKQGTDTTKITVVEYQPID